MTRQYDDHAADHAESPVEDCSRCIADADFFYRYGYTRPATDRYGHVDVTALTGDETEAEMRAIWGDR